MIKNNIELVAKLKDIALNYKTVYANGMFGQPITESIIAQKTRQLPKWYTAERQTNLRALIGKGYFGFDCICFVKSLFFWDWTGDASNVNGGAKYDGNTDYTEKQLLNKCSDVSDDFSKIEIGEYLYMSGHCGIYIGNGEAIECTPKWENGVQITAVHNIGKIDGMNGRIWEKHGKLPTIEYVVCPEDKEKDDAEQTKGEVTLSLNQLSRGKYKGNAQVFALQRLLKLMGYYYKDIDGDFGSGTEMSVKNFQKDRKIQVDGIVGRDTWSHLLTIL